MNEVIENILTRRSVRSFDQMREISRADIELLIKAASYAPSGMNKQTWQFTAVTNRTEIARLARVTADKLGREGYDMYKPAALIIPSNLQDSYWGVEDNALALENIFLAAHSLGIGSVWLNQLRTICEEPEVRAILTEWGIPAGHVVYGIAALGYPSANPSAPPRNPVVRIVE